MKNSQFTIVDRTGETATALNGQKMTIVAYRSSRDMDVQFEDGTIVTVRKRDGGDQGAVKLDDFIATVQKETADRV